MKAIIKISKEQLAEIIDKYLKDNNLKRVGELSDQIETAYYANGPFDSYEKHLFKGFEIEVETQNNST